MLLIRLLVLCVCLFTLVPAHAVRVSSEPDVRAEFFPEATGWLAMPASVVETARRDISRDAQVTLAAARFAVWRVMQGDQVAGYFVTDQVIGKFQKIDYAVALDAEGSVRGVRVLQYRESHGHEVAEHAWLAQFVGRTAKDSLKPGRDVDGITGATLSVVHMAEGVRRVTRLVVALKSAGN